MRFCEPRAKPAIGGAAQIQYGKLGADLSVPKADPWTVPCFFHAPGGRE